MSPTKNPSDRQWYAFRNSTEAEVEIYLYDEIGFWGTGAKEFMSELRQHAGKHVHLRINSPGGEVIEGTAIYNALLRHQGGLTVHIDALAASMASVIAMSGSPIFMADNALMMIHDPYTFAAGTSEELRKSADLLDTMKAALVRAYVKKTGKTEKEISDLMEEETWMGATEAAALGFIDGIEDGVAAAACMTPDQARARFDMLKKVMANESDPAPETLPVPPAPETVPPAPETTPVPETVPDVPETPEIPAPSAKVDVAAMTAAVQAMAVERDQFRARAEKAEADLLSVQSTLANLEKSKGLAPAAVVPPVEPSKEAAKSLSREAFDKLPIDAQNDFFRNGGHLI